MAEIVKKIDVDNDLTVFTVIGKVAAEAVVTAIKEFYESSVTSNVLWDFTESDLTGIQSTDVSYIAELSHKYMERRSTGKTAIVGPDDLSYGLLRMYEITKDHSSLPFATESFRNIDDAYEWLLKT